jgi:DnaJ-class molecular chaperone
MSLCNVKHHLKVLGLGNKVSKKDIRLAYHKLALKYHPDKNAESDLVLFHEIQKSYETLISLLPFDNENAEIDVTDQKSEEYWSEFLSLMLKEMTTFMQKQKTQPSKSHQRKKSHDDNVLHRSNMATDTQVLAKTSINIDATIEDLYFGHIKKIKYVYLPWGNLEYLKDEVYISLKGYQHTYIFPSKGDFVSETSRCDLIINLNILPHDFCYVDTIFNQYDLYIDYHMSLSEYYLRTFLAFEHFKEVIDIPYYVGKKMHVVHGKGLPYIKDNVELRGDLYVHFHTTLPLITSIPEDLKLCLQKYFVT